MDITLIGGGWDPDDQARCLRPFLASARARAGARLPRVGFVWIDEGDGTDWGGRWVTLVRAQADVEPVDLRVPIGHVLDPGPLGDVDAVFVCGGLTPAYAASLAPAADRLRALVLDEGLPYAGSSAGAVVAARRAVVGGYLDGNRVVCPEDAAEDLDDVTVVDGLGLVAEMVDVHASAWGTLPRLAAALARASDVDRGIGVDEDTAWRVTERGGEVLGRNAVHELTRLRTDVDADDALRWVTRRATAR